jgi:hypothetical protein
MASQKSANRQTGARKRTAIMAAIKIAKYIKIPLDSRVLRYWRGRICASLSYGNKIREWAGWGNSDFLMRTGGYGASGGAGLSLCLLAAFDVQCMMDPIQRAVAMPPRKIVMQRAVHDGPNVDLPLTAAASRGKDQWLDICPFVISQVARISQVIAVVLRPVLVRPHCKPLRASADEDQRFRLIATSHSN